MTIQKISPKEFQERLNRNEKVVVVDVRAEEKYKDFHLTEPQIESHNIPKTVIFEVDETKESSRLPLPKQEEIIVTCTTGNSATKCANILSSLNYNVIVLEGGLTAWKEYRNLPKD